MAHWGVIWGREGDGQKRRFVLDFGRYGKIYSHKGVRLESREQAQALLDTIRILGQEIGKQHAVDRFAPMASKKPPNRPVARALALGFRAAGEGRRARAANAARVPPLGEGRRPLRLLAQPQHPHAVGPLASREYLKWLRLRNVTGKTAWNVVAGFHSFLGWLVEVERLAAIPTDHLAEEAAGAIRRRSGRQPSGRSWRRSRRRSAASSWLWRCSVSGRARRWR